MSRFTLDDAQAIARDAHRGQVDKLGVDYMEHVEAVASALAGLDLDLQIAGMLHDVVEDSDLTIEDLRLRGVPERALAAVALVSNNLHPGSYLEHIAVVCRDRDATLVKISDNLHNSRPDRVQALAKLTGRSVNPKYEAAREMLWNAADSEDLAAILDSIGERDVEALLWRVDQDALYERWGERGFEPLFEVLDESSYYGDGGGMVDYVLKTCLQLMPDGRVCGLVYGDESEHFDRDWPADDAGQSYVRYEWDQLVAQYRIES